MGVQNQSISKYGPKVDFVISYILKSSILTMTHLVHFDCVESHGFVSLHMRCRNCKLQHSIHPSTVVALNITLCRNVEKIEIYLDAHLPQVAEVSGEDGGCVPCKILREEHPPLKFLNKKKNRREKNKEKERRQRMTNSKKIIHRQQNKWVKTDDFSRG